MDSNLEAKIIQLVCKHLHEQYGYTKKECQAYIKGYEDCQAFMAKQMTLSDQANAEKEYYQMIIPDEE